MALAGIIYSLLNLAGSLTMAGPGELARRKALAEVTKFMEDKLASDEKLELSARTIHILLQAAIFSRERRSAQEGERLFSSIAIILLSTMLLVASRNSRPISSK